jgi:hypothetical protein
MVTSEDEIQTIAYHQNLIARKYKMNISSTKTKSLSLCGNHIQRVKIVINDSPIEQVSDFKYLAYLISDYRSDLENKLQTYNKINGIIQRYFGKEMTKETKLKIPNITAESTYAMEKD